MKKQTWFAFSWLFALAVIGVSCNDALSPESKSELKTELSAKYNATIVMATQEALDITASGMSSQGITGGRVADGGEGEDEDHDRLCGATVTKSVTMVNNMPDSLTITGSITIDFGDGAQCGDSTHRRSGSITTEFNITVSKKDHRAYHSVETVTLHDFTQDSKTMSGTFISKAAPGGLQWLKVQNAVLTYEDSVNTTITWSGELTITKDNGGTPKPDDDIKTIAGSITGTTIDGTFTSEITNDLIIKWECYRGRNIPVSGMIVVTTPDAVTTLDFGDGTCDKLYTSITDGTTTELHF